MSLPPRGPNVPPGSPGLDPPSLNPPNLGLPGGSMRGLNTAMARLRHRWGWFVALGALALVFGVLALGMIVTATLTTVVLVAIFMIIKGGSEITVGLNSRTWGREILLIVAGLAYIVAGAFALAQPGPAAVAFTLVLGIAMVVAGGTRIAVGLHMAGHGRAMVTGGGVVTALIGLLVVAGWPVNSLFILGALLGLDLLFTGVMWIGFGLRLRHHAL